MKKVKRNYINNKDLYNALVEYQQSNKDPKTKSADYIGTAIRSIAMGLSSKPRFNGYSYKEEMIADGIYDCLLYGVNNFNPKYTNPFAYFTEIIKKAFYRKIEKERRQQYLKYKSLEEQFMLDEMDEFSSVKKIVEENLQIYISDYERQMREKKVKPKPIGIEKFIEEDNDEERTKEQQECTPTTN